MELSGILTVQAICVFSWNRVKWRVVAKESFLHFDLDDSKIKARFRSKFISG